MQPRGLALGFGALPLPLTLPLALTLDLPWCAHVVEQL